MTSPEPSLEVWCRAICLDLPDATVDQPFGPGAETFRVRRKVFALLMDVPHVSPHPLVNLKADPAEVPLLIGTHSWVLPGYHMNKRHWVSLELGGEIDLELAASLVEDSYDAVVHALPARLRSSLGRGRQAHTSQAPRRPSGTT